MNKSASMMTPAELAAYSRRAEFKARALQSGQTDFNLTRYQLAPAPAKPRRIGLVERLIAGPEVDPNLWEKFCSFLGCLACGTALALLLVAIVVFFRVVQS